MKTNSFFLIFTFIILSHCQYNDVVKNQIYFDPGTGDLFKNVGKEGEAPRFVLVVPDKK